MRERRTWEDCIAFHGHVCGGLAIGYRAAQYASGLLELEYSKDEQVVCIAENDACGVDAIQVMLGCSVGKGNLLFRLRGKQAFSFYNRRTGRSVRLVLRPKPEDFPKRQKSSGHTDVTAAGRLRRSTGFVCPAIRSCAWTVMKAMTDLVTE